ncbi:MAG: hypothetical protein V1672_01200 [Candidatus Diapherotrites archaeon]
MERKGQSALEYLMTYGWALIVIAIVIGVLVFIMSTTTAGSNCTSDNTQIIYVDHAVDASGGIDLKVQNGAGQTISITAITMQNGFTGTPTAPTLPASVVSGAETTIESPTGVGTGSTYRGEVALTYIRGTGGITHNATLTCTGTAA